MAHRVGFGPGGPVLFWTILEPLGLLCSVPDCSRTNQKGLELIGHKALMYSFIEFWENVCKVPGPSTLWFLQCAQCRIIGSPSFGIVLSGRTVL